MEGHSAEAVRGKEEERGQIPSFQTIDLRNLAAAAKQQADQKKYMYIADMSGKASTFFKYQSKWAYLPLYAELKICLIS